jgi:transcriptional regulator with XRE-family HTH domain
MQAGLTQSELAQRADSSRSMIAQVEMGERRPSRKLLARLARALELDAQTEDRLHVAFGYTPGGDTPEQIAAFLRADKRLSPDQAERLAALVRQAYFREVEGTSRSE